MTRLKIFDFASIVLLITTVIATVRNVFLPGLYTAHDSMHHFVRLYHFVYELQHLQIPVRVATTLANSYGYPLFNYTYSLPYMLGAIGVSLGMNYSSSLKAVIVASSLVSIIFWYAWLRRHFSVLPALLGTLLYWLVPYRFLTIFVTFQLGAIVAGAFFSLAVLGLDMLLEARKTFDAQQRLGFALSAIGLAGVMLSHLVSLYIYLPFLALFVIWKLYFNSEMAGGRKFVIQNVTALLWLLVISLGITAFYWIPATAELNWVSAGHKEIVLYYQHFTTVSQLLKSSWGYGYSELGPVDGMSFQIGYAQVIALAVGAVMLLLGIGTSIRQRIFPKNSTKNLGLLAVSVISACIYVFLMLEVSDLVWKYMPLISSIQHPWRLLIGVAAGASVSTAVIASSRWGKVLAIGLVCLALFNVRNYQRPISFEYQLDEVLLQSVEMTRSADISWEFLPTWAQPLLSAPDSMIARSPVGSTIAYESEGEISLFATQSGELVLNKIYLPLWNVQMGDKPASTHMSSDGLLATTVEPGEHQISLTVGQTPIEIAGNIIAICSVLFLILASTKRLRLAGLLY